MAAYFLLFLWPLTQAAPLIALDTESVVDLSRQPVSPRMQLLQLAVPHAPSRHLATKLSAC